MINIKLNEEFSGAGRIWMFDNSSGKVILKNLREAGKSRTKEFIPPTLNEVKKYFEQEGYKEDVAERAFRHYNSANWHNSKGKKVLNWKQTMGTNWMTPENKIKESSNQFNEDNKDPKFLFG